MAKKGTMMNKTTKAGMSVIAFLTLGFVLFVPSETRADVLVIEPQQAYAGSEFVFRLESTSVPPERPDVIARYRVDGSTQWVSFALDSESDLAFSGSISEAIPGEYQVEWGYARIPDLPVAEWNSADGFAVHPGWIGSSWGCAGYDTTVASLEQSYNNLEVSLDLPPTIVENETVAMPVPEITGLPSGSEASLLWCSSRGNFSLDANGNALFTAPRVPADGFEAAIKVLASTSYGDLGKFQGRIIIQNEDDYMPGDPPPLIEVISVGIYESDRNVLPVEIRCSDRDENDLDASDNLLSDIYVYSDTTGATVGQVEGLRGGIDWVVEVPLASDGWSAPLRVVASSTDGNSVFSSETLIEDIQPLSELTVVALDTEGVGVPDVAVELEGFPGLWFTDETGVIQIVDIPAGSYLVTPSLTGITWVPESYVVTLDPSVSTSNLIVFVESLSFMEVAIDIKPGSEENPVNYASNGKIPVAILSSASFNALAEVDQPTLRFGRTGTEDSLHYRGNGEPNCSGDEDHSGDGLADLLCHFNTPETGFQPEDTEGILRGFTFDGEAFEGRDNVTIVGPGIFSSSFESGNIGDWSSGQ